MKHSTFNIQHSNLTSSALECIHLWNSAFGQPEDIAYTIFEKATEYKRRLTQQVSKLWPKKAKTPEKEAELLIGVLLSSVMVSIPNTQLLLDRSFQMLSKLSDSPLKARLSIALYTLTDDEEDRDEALRIINSWEESELTEEEMEAKTLVEDILSFMV